MINGLDSVSSGVEALGRQYEAITYNLANASTVSYKRRCNTFSEVLASRMNPSAPPSPGASKINTNFVMDYSQGSLAATGRPLDLALDGKGFFVVETPQGEIYTRNGTFQINAQSQLVDYAGRTVAGESGPIILPANASMAKVNVSLDGNVSVGGASVGKLKIRDFDDPSRLEPIEGNAYKASDLVVAVPAKPTTAVRQGFQESSNVNVVTELVNLITVSRLYESNIHSIQTQDEKMKNILQTAAG